MLVIGAEQEPGQLTISGKCADKNGTPENATAVVVVIDTSQTNIKEKFSVEQEPGQLTISGKCADKNGTPVNATAVVVVIDTSKTNIKDNFVTDPTLTGAKAVDAAFRELSAFIADGGLTKGVIKLNDYIELEGGLTVEAYKEAGGFSYADDPGWDTEITKKSGAEVLGYMK
jgi:hypothetical protein